MEDLKYFIHIYEMRKNGSRSKARTRKHLQMVMLSTLINNKY